MFVRAPTDILMKANDYGWRAAKDNTPGTYQRRIKRNSLNRSIVGADRGRGRYIRTFFA